MRGVAAPGAAHGWRPLNKYPLVVWRESRKMPDQMLGIPNLPSTERGDAAEVALALETARSLWLQGQGLESVRWIQRAAENAESSGDDLRAVSLARAAADLRAEAAALTLDDFSEQTIVDAPDTALLRQALPSSPQLAIPAPAPVLIVPPLVEHQTLRVAVISQDQQSRQLTLRVLGQGEAAPAGSTEALLVSLDAQQRLSL